MPTSDSSDSLSGIKSELNQPSQRPAQPLQQAVDAAMLSCHQNEERSADGLRLGYNSASESRQGPEVQVQRERHSSADSNLYPEHQQLSEAQPEEDSSRMQADEGSTNLQPVLPHDNEQSEQEDGNSASQGIASTAELPDQEGSPRAAGDGQHAVKTSEEPQSQPGESLEQQISDLKLTKTEPEDIPGQPASAAQGVGLPETAQLTSGEQDHQTDSPVADTEYSVDPEMRGQPEPAIGTELVHQSPDGCTSADKEELDLYALQAAKARTSIDSDDVSLSTAASSCKPARLGLKVAGNGGSEQQPTEEEFSFPLSRPKSPKDEAGSPAGSFASSADSSRGSFTLKSRLSELLRAAAAKKGLPGANQRQQEQLQGQTPTLKGAAEISDEWNEDDDTTQSGGSREDKGGLKAYRHPNFQMTALAGKAQALEGASSEGKTGDPGEGPSSSAPAPKPPLAPGLIDFDDLPIMRKKPLKKRLTGVAAVPVNASDEWAGSSPGADGRKRAEHRWASSSNAEGGSSIGPAVGDHIFKCDQCRFSTESALRLKQHTQMKHPYGQKRKEVFECEVCNLKVYDQDVFLSHMQGRPHAVKERAVQRLQNLQPMTEGVRPKSERAALQKRLQDPDSVPTTKTSLPPASGECLMEQTAAQLYLPRSIRQALAGPQPGFTPRPGRGCASQREPGLIFEDVPPRRRQARGPPLAARTALSSGVSDSMAEHGSTTTDSTGATGSSKLAAGSLPKKLDRPRPKSLSESSTGRSVSTGPTASSACLTRGSSICSGPSSITATGTASTRISAASVRSLFLCPLTKEIMRDPVLCPDGHTYERHAIEEYLSKHGKSPVTGQPIASGEALPANRLVRQAAAEAGITPDPDRDAADSGKESED